MQSVCSLHVASVRIWLGAFLLGVLGCGGAAPPSAPRPRPELTEPMRVTECRATPSTAYGDERPLFEFSAAGSVPHPVRAELRDESGRSVWKGEVSVPGTFSMPDFGSGDFELSFGPAAPTCKVTVNRELSRATTTTP